MCLRIQYKCAKCEKLKHWSICMHPTPQQAHGEGNDPYSSVLVITLIIQLCTVCTRNPLVRWVNRYNVYWGRETEPYYGWIGDIDGSYSGEIGALFILGINTTLLARGEAKAVGPDGKEAIVPKTVDEIFGTNRIQYAPVVESYKNGVTNWHPFYDVQEFAEWVRKSVSPAESHASEEDQ